MAGNVGLLKHASNVPQCALAIEEIFRRAGFVEGTFQTLLIGSAPVAKIIADERVKAVTLTGSEPAGSKVAAQAGSVIKKTILELGGSDPFIIMPGADLPKAIETAVKARTINNGQSCIAAKRFIVHEQIYDEFEAKFIEQMLALKVGNPLEKETEIGPLATEVLREDLDKQVRTAVSAGAKVLCGGKKIEGKGYFYEPTVLVNVSKDSPVFYEELFGPAAMLFRVKDIDEAIKLANDSPFGLGSSVWTRDEKEQEKFASEIEAGQTFINAMVASDPRLPFGGIKHSGYGRELSVQGIREFVNAKTIFIR
jgi:succinate-semialdehyde dehydrogenase/glutarate-semialdehyde dehydrogenase